jgi:hypothetical protein
MAKKMMLLAGLVFTLGHAVSANVSNPYGPFPGCYPCSGDGNLTAKVSQPYGPFPGCYPCSGDGN